MTFDLEKIIESKHALRSKLAARPIGEKLRLLDALRDREISLRSARLDGRKPESDETPSESGATEPDDRP